MVRVAMAGTASNQSSTVETTIEFAITDENFKLPTKEFPVRGESNETVA